ncbi:MAG: fimbrillin family protein [Bacteroidales bacterium]|nr:fimbrillin family protein [Bacteroidales bacterium]
MKKTFLLMGIAALAFASCAKDTVSEINNGRAIDFRVATETRATETTVTNLTSFNVTAISAAETDEGDIEETANNYFEDVLFSVHGTAGEEGAYFVSSPAYYWPEVDGLNFYAYAPTSLKALVTINNTSKSATNFTPAVKLCDQVDFVVATAYGDNGDQEYGVALDFKHMLSQIEIKAKNGDDRYVYTVAGVKIDGVYPTGTVVFTDPSAPIWTPSGNVYTYYVNYDAKVDESGKATVEFPVLDETAQTLTLNETDLTVTENAMLIPQNLANLNAKAKLGVYVNVTSKTGVKVFPKTGDYGWKEVEIDTEWEHGYKYVYTLDLTTSLGEPIKFTTSVTGWDEQLIPEDNETPDPEDPTQDPEGE